MQHSQDRSGEHVGDYRLLRQVGEGSFGEVYQAEDRRSHHLVAVKLLKTSLTRREDLKAFLNEARAFRLHHPHIVPLLDFGLSEHDLPFLVMEYVAGGTLRDHYPKDSQVPLDVVVDLTGQIASALQYAHDQHLVHRDVKPENMLCRTDGTVLLSDFGIASVAPASNSVSLSQEVGGTLSYMAPEQLQGKPRPQSDQYALAVVVYEWLAGMRPFQGTALELISQHLHMPPPRLLDRVPLLPAAVEQIVFKALAKQPEDRFACVQDFATALQTAYQPTILLPPAPTPLPSLLSSPSPKNMPSTHFPSSPTPAAPAGWSQSATGRPVREPGAEVSFSRHSSVPPLSSPSGGSIAPPLLPTPPLSAYRWRHLRSVFVLLFCFVLVVGASGGAIWGVKGYQAQQRTSSLTATTTAALLATATATTKACQAATANGTQFGFDTANTHWNRCEQRINTTNVTRLSVLWYYTEPYGFGDPTVANGKVYIASTGQQAFRL